LTTTLTILINYTRYQFYCLHETVRVAICRLESRCVMIIRWHDSAYQN